MANQHTSTDRRTDATELPVPTDDARTYIQVRPTADAIDADAAEAQFRRLHQLEQPGSDGLLDRLVNRQSTPTIECRFVSEGDDRPIQYAFGVDDEATIDTLERVLRSLFPDAYEFERTTESPAHCTALLDETLAAVEICGLPDRRDDWQTRLTPFAEFATDGRRSLPLAAVLETMANHDGPIVYQALLTPEEDWSSTADERITSLRYRQDTLGDQLLNTITGRPDNDAQLTSSDEQRLEEIRAKDTRSSFAVTSRIAVGAETDTAAKTVATELASAFAGVSYTSYDIDGRVSTGSSADAVCEKLRDRTTHAPRASRLRTRLPLTSNRSRALLADASEAPSFCLVGGEALTAAGVRAVSPTPGERTAVPRPPVDLLRNYRGAGFTLGTPLTQDGAADTEPLVLPPQLQPLHLALFGKTGAGKSVALSTGILQNHVATDGADIHIEPKSDEMVTDLLAAHYQKHGTLENVLYFDCSEVLPAFSFFNIRDELDAGVSRTTAVEDSVDHYLEMLRGLMGRDRFERAVRSPDVIRYLVKAMYDPVSGDDAFAHRELHVAVREMHERQSAPPVADGDLERMLNGVVANNSRSFDEIMQGVANRMEKIPVDKRLAAIFNHVPEEGDPHFDLADYLDDDVLIVFDTSGLRSDAQRVLTLVILSNLWTALRRRKRRSDGDLPLVNLSIEEAASVAVSDLLGDLLAQARGFGCSVTLAMQYPAPLRQQSQDVYDEVLNNVSTFLTGNVPVDRKLAERLATDEMSPQDVGNRLRALRRGQWLVSLPAAFDQPEPRPFLLESATPPPGHPAGPQPLSETEQERFAAALDTVHDRTKADAGLTLDAPSTPEREDTPDDDGSLRVDTALPHTNRMPPTVEYRAGAHLLACAACDGRFDPDVDGMRQAIECCSALERTDSDDVPICELNLKLTQPEREANDYTDHQLMFCQAVYNAQQLRYDDLEYDLKYDSMIRLQEYVGVDSEAVQDLIDDGLLTHDDDRPHRLYTVTPDGRSTIGERYRLGVDYGHGKGDLEETSQHVLGVELGRLYLVEGYEQDPDSPVVRVVPYFDLDQEDGTVLPMAAAMGEDEDELEEASDEYDHRRLDVAGLDEDGNVVVAIEVERINHDHRRAVPADFDKMAACGPDEALWIAMSHSEAHEVLAALNDPLEGEPRVEKTYSENTPAHQLQFDTPGCTGMLTLEQVRDRVESATDTMQATQR